MTKRKRVETELPPILVPSSEPLPDPMCDDATYRLHRLARIAWRVVLRREGIASALEVPNPAAEEFEKRVRENSGPPKRAQKRATGEGGTRSPPSRPALRLPPADRG